MNPDAELPTPAEMAEIDRQVLADICAAMIRQVQDDAREARNCSRRYSMTPDGWSRRALHEATSARFRAFFTGRTPADRRRRVARLHRWSWAFRKQSAKARLERYGLDVTGHGAAAVRRVMRNARKAERA